MGFKRFEELEVWQLSRILVRDSYIFSRGGLVSKDYGFIDQIRRSSLSVMNNIAEGFERKSIKEFIQFLYIAKSSCGEVRSMLYVALDIGYIDEIKFQEMLAQTEKISKSLSGFIRFLKRKEE